MDTEFVKHQFEDGHDGVIVKNKFKLGVRHVQIVYMWLCGAVFGAVRGSASIALLAATDRERINDTYIQIHDWDRRIQGTILSSFFFGYALMLLPAELFLKKMSGKYVLTAMLLGSGSLSVAMPTIVNKGGWIAMWNAHLWMGMTQACFSPCNQALLDKWLPPDEKARFSWVVNSGSLLGIIIAMPISGLLSESRLGWELVFYAQAMLTLSMAAVWGLLTSSSPETHQAVGDEEKEYIRENLGRYKKKSLRVPWRSIMKSGPFWGIVCAHAASNVIYVFYLTELPAFLKVYGSSLRSISWKLIFPFVALWLSRMLTAPTVNWLCKTLQLNFNFNFTFIRKLINTMGACFVIAGLAALPDLFPGWPRLTICTLIAIMGSIGFQFSGFLDNIKDISENYAGVLLMMSSLVASVAGAAVPAVCGLITGDETTDLLNRYRIVFLTLAVVYVGLNTAYMVLATSERQYWDEVVIGHKFGHHNAFIDANNVELEEMSNRHQNHRRHDYNIDI